MQIEKVPIIYIRERTPQSVHLTAAFLCQNAKRYCSHIFPLASDSVTVKMEVLKNADHTGGSGKESPVRVPPVGAKVTDKVTAAERKELLSRNPVNVHNSSVDNSAKSDIIKAITIDDFNETDSKGVISKECKETIMNTLKEQGVSYVYDEIKIVNIPRSADGKIEPLRTNAISSPSYPKIVLEVNEAAFGGRSKEQIDLMFKAQDYSVANSLEEAVVHESAHAKVIQDKTYANYEAINEELSGDRFKTPIKDRDDKKSLKDLAGGISKYAQKDGLECIAETHIKLRRGENVPKELKGTA